MIKKIVMNAIAVVLIGTLFTSCTSIKQTSEPNNQEITNETAESTVETGGSATTVPTQKLTDFDQSLSDDNIRGYYGLMWESLPEGVQYSLYFKAFSQRVLFNDIYSSIWVEGNEEQNNPVSIIRDSKDKKNQLLGIAFKTPITTKVDQLPKEIAETWFNTVKEHNYLFVKTEEGKWYSYKVLDDHLKGDFNILSTVLNSIDQINNTTA